MKSETNETTAVKQAENGKEQIRKLVEYLVEYSRLKTPQKFTISDYEWTLALAALPDHPCIEWYRNPPEHAGDRPLLRIRRPELSDCPKPPFGLLPYLMDDWDEFEVKKAKLKRKPQGSAEYPPEIVTEFEQWQLTRDQWRIQEVPARQTFELFDRLFQLKGTLDREGERHALTLGDGILNWHTTEYRWVDHPILLQRCSLDFQPDGPQFIISFSDEPLQFPTVLLRDLEGADQEGLRIALESIRQSPFDVLSEEAVDFMRGLVRRMWSRGEFYPEAPLELPRDCPSLRRDPVLILAPRGRGYAEAAEFLLHALEEFEVPPALLNLVGREAPSNPHARHRAAEMRLLFTKASNGEQERVARRLESYGCVLVQGPPGTGKTHTIANLIGHLLAQGKSILVTSHTSKALAVVRDQVVEELRSLCVSMLDDGPSSHLQLETAVKSIASKLTETTGDELEAAAQKLRELRETKLQQLKDCENRLIAAHRGEYEDLVVGGEVQSPLSAARRLREWHGTHNWIPGSVSLGQVCSLSNDEVEELYALQVSLPLEDEVLLEGDLPKAADLIEPAELESLSAREKHLRALANPFGEQFWTRPCFDLKAIEQALSSTMTILSSLEMEERWLRECFSAASQPSEAKLWRELLSLIEQTASDCALKRSMIYDSHPEIQGLDWPLPRLLDACKGLLDHIRAGKKIGTFMSNLTLKADWKLFLKAASVQSATPTRVDHFEALLALLELRVARQRLTSRWMLQMEGLDAPRLPEEAPEREAIRLAERIAPCLDWQERIWAPFESSLLAIGLNWPNILAQVSSQTGNQEHIARVRQAVSGPLVQTLEARRNQLLLAALESELAHTQQILGNSQSPLAKELFSQIQIRDVEFYRQGWNRLRHLEQQVKRATRRQTLLDRLREVAPSWSRALADRAEGHKGPNPPGSLAEAWLYAQWSQQLADRHLMDLDQLQRQMSEYTEQLQKLTAQYVETLTWQYQAQRTGVAQRQALNGWLESMRRIGKGTGKQAPMLKALAREKLRQCRSAVPVWIMPFSRVVESYRPVETMFDVVIVDEASQADVTGLLAFALGKEVVVVGDDKQVSPTAFEQGEKTLALAKERLIGIPNWELFSGQRSVYDMAATSFGETIRLKEHFRCVPEIIAFSNELCYDGEIRPLRESNRTLTPAVVAHRVLNGQRHGRAKTNEQEAREIAALIQACIEQPEYANKTFGVISLVGDDQALLIQRYLNEILDPNVIQERRILCGNASQFQGDERDIVFLSMVSSPTSESGPMRLVEGRREDQQRYNVAASRARDQMWIVHSFQPSNDLQPNDLRARLLKQAERPGQEAQVELLKRQTESPFEEQVLERLIRAGYQVEPQFAVGAYRVDMVIKGYSRRVAIECDGEAYHGLDRVKADLDRQRILERVARLTFIRIRGSLYFRDPEEAMRLVFQRLEELGIEKVGTNVRELAPASSELKERVVRRCQQIRGESNGGSATIDDCWRLLKTLLRDWPQLRAQIHDSNFEVRALSVSHDHEEVILVDAKSPALVAFAQLAKLRYLKTLEVDPEQPHEALNQLLRAFKLDQQVDSQETFAAVESHPKPAVSPITTPPEETLTAPQAIVAVLMQVVKADGVVLAEELNGVEEFFSKRFNFGSQTAEEVRHWIDLYSSQEAPRGPVSRALRSLSQSHRELVLQGAIELAWCDHQFHASEQSVIRSLGIELDLDLATVEGLLAQNRREEFDPYKVLGLTSLAQPREIFEAVQRLRMKFHRSLFDTQEVEFQNLAATRRAEIEKAWNALRPAEEISKPELGSFDLSIFPAYRAFEGYAGPDPRDAPLSAVMDGLVEILQVESPVSTSRLFEVYLRGCGIKRLGHELRKYLTRALGWAVERQLARVVEGQDHSSPLAVVALPSGPSVFIRERGPRTFDQIPDGELKDLGRRLSSQHQDGSEEHLRAILDHYEFKRLTSGTRDRLMDALAGRARREVESDGQERELGGLPD